MQSTTELRKPVVAKTNRMAVEDVAAASASTDAGGATVARNVCGGSGISASRGAAP